MEPAVLRAFEDAFNVAGAVLRAFEDASRTTGACFVHRISLPYRKRLFFTPNASENASRTPGSLFEHGAHIPYHRRAFPVPNARHRGRLPPQRRRLPCLRRDNQAMNLIEVRSFRRASENASHLVVRSTGKRVAVASERPVYPRTGAVSGTECRRRGRGRLPPQRRRLPCLRRDNQAMNLIEVRSFRRASENASHLVVRSTGKRVAVASERPVYPRTGAVSGTECRRRGRGRVRRSGAWHTEGILVDLFFCEVAD